ncbi:hypothetical protein CSA37_01855 [Candidatus Fermentibacteria bacterium]|nr:MAG: hypothetical protein CSA37_01855 [Candidatus Fermentibacteria bacterium]
MNREEMLEFAAAAVDAAGTPDAVAELTEVRDASVRFSRNRITRNTDVFTRKLRLTAGRDRKKVSVSTDKIAFEELKTTAIKAERLLDTASPDPEYMPPVSAGQKYREIPEAWNQEIAGCPAEMRMDAAVKVLNTASSKGYEAGGVCTMSVRKRAVYTSTGNGAFHRRTDSSMSFTMARGLASSYRALSGTGWNELDISDAVSSVADEVEMSMNGEDLEPGSCSIILEPEATWNLVIFLPWIMSAREADQGLSVFSGMEGKKVTGEGMTLSSRLHGGRPGIPFNEEGLPAGDTVWIEKGVLRNLPCDRFTAKKTGRPALFFPETMDMEGGEGSTADLVSSVKRGVLIRRFRYIRLVDRKTLKLKGLTRDGVFLVENGRIVRPVKNFRWSWRLLELFSSIENIGTPVRKTPGMIPPVVISPQTNPFTDKE